MIMFICHSNTQEAMQEDGKFKTTLDYTVSPYLKKENYYWINPFHIKDAYWTGM